MGEYTIGLSYIGRRCLFVTRVSGFSRLPVPPARTMPFIFSLSPARADSTCQGALIIASSDVTRNDVMNRFARLPSLACSRALLAPAPCSAVTATTGATCTLHFAQD